ncbi:ATP-binding protein [Streptomyces sp. NPDC005438]|uniref:sensor histidine kinase n=1 Tax=Streptomyces sp. NPDC005438 TaxID=3156880 RepID=UPI00339E95CC
MSGHPPEVGPASAEGADDTGGPPARRPRRLGRLSLQRQLVLSAVGLIAVVCSVIAVVTILVLQSNLRERLDADLRASVQRSLGPVNAPHRTSGDDIRFVALPGQPIGTVGARLDEDGEIRRAVRSTGTGGPNARLDQRVEDLDRDQRAALARVTRDGRPHSVDLPGLGSYRVQSSPPGWPASDPPNGPREPSPRETSQRQEPSPLLVALPEAEYQRTITTLLVTELCVTAAGLIAAVIAGSALVRVALRPLHRVASTATRVSQLRLHHGEVEIRERVPETDTDPRTEVGQVGGALNRLLGHVSSALSARQASETRVRRFVADASHELRTPLASIRGYAELTRRAPEHADSADTRYALGRIEAEARRMTVLVEDLLSLARLDNGRPQEYSEVDLSVMLSDGVNDARAASPGHRWRLQMPAEPVCVWGERSGLHQVFGNLLANARVHTPEGTTVTTRILRPDPDSEPDRVRVEIEDDGPGVPPEALPHIFERFVRGDPSRARSQGQSQGGTGLGLALVKAVVEGHQGRVEVRSAPGRTVFTVDLPVTPTPEDEPAPGSPE